MNMEFYRELYVSRSLKKREKRIIEGLKKKRFRKDLYLIVLVQDVYQKTNDVRLREFILNNQKQSGEGSV